MVSNDVLGFNRKMREWKKNDLLDLFNTVRTTLRTEATDCPGSLSKEISHDLQPLNEWAFEITNYGRSSWFFISQIHECPLAER